MKKITFPILALLLITGISCQETIDIEKEKEAIIKVVQEEADSFYDRDIDRFLGIWVQDETLSRIDVGKNGYGYVIGWEEIEPTIRNFFENNPEPVTVNMIRTNYEIKVFKETAWATFNEQNGPDGRVQQKVEFLEKVEGEWKIGYIIIIGVSSYDEEVVEEEGESEAEE